MQNGFLPEPIPTADVSEDRIAAEAQRLASGAASLPNATSPLFKAAKEEAFRRAGEGLNIEQLMARHSDVFETGIATANVPVTAEDVRKLAKKIGDEETSGVVSQMLDSSRLFRRWVNDVISAIAQRHFPENGTPDVVVSVPHLDLPLEPKDDAHAAIIYRHVYDDEAEDYKTKAFVLAIPWPGRHVLRVNGSWVDFIVCLMRQICSLTD